MLRQVLKNYIFPALMLIVSAVGGYYLSIKGFDSVREMRQLERVPSSKVGALLPGEANVTATASMYRRTVDSFYTKTPSIYYEYREEREETDSDGNTSWRTVDSRVESVDFYIKDNTGKALVNRASVDIDWSIPESFQVINGDRRYTEWRIEPGDKVFIFAYAELIGNQINLDFSTRGQYTPIISKYSEAEERSDMGAMSIFQIWLGVTLLSLCVYFISYLFKIHRLVAYLSLLTVALSILLTDMGMSMMRDDLVDGLARYQQQNQAASDRVRDLLQRAGVTFYGWHDLHELSDVRYENVSGLSKKKIREIRLNLLMAREQLIKDMQSTPEKWFVGMWNITQPDAVSTPAKTQNEVAKKMAAYKPGQLNRFWPGIFVVSGFVLAVVFIWFGIRQVKLKRYIENLATSDVSGVAYGVTEVKGKLVLKDEETALRSPLTDSECAWYYYLVEERRGSGKNAKWVTIKEVTESKVFYCKDHTGEIQINADKAEVISDHYNVKRTGSLKYTEKALNLNDELYVIGYANLGEHLSEKLQVSYNNERDPFIISNKTEKQVMTGKARKGIFNLNLAFSSALLTALLLFGMSGDFAPTDFLLSALMAPVFMMIIMMVLHYNDIVFLRQRVERNASNIQVSLKKRYNLIPNIEDIVKGYTRHESLLLNNIAEYRSEFQHATKNAEGIEELIKKQVKLKININNLREDYPELKSNELVNKMMDILSALEDELMYMRSGYNDAVEVYNTRIRSVPDILFAGMLGFTEKNFLKV